MLEIRKISENFYLVDGEYTASTFNDAVIIANQSKGKIKNFELGYMETSLWRKIKNKLNLPFLLLESCDVVSILNLALATLLVAKGVEDEKNKENREERNKNKRKKRNKDN